MLFSYSALLRAVSDVFRGNGLHEDDAQWAAQCLVDTEARGVFSHGVHLIGEYTNGLKNRTTNPDAKLKIVADAPCAVRIDGQSGMGQCVMRDVTDLLIARAKVYGCATATVTNVNHFGAGLVYAKRAMDAGMIVSLYCNTPTLLAPFGAKQSFFGTNPITYGVPSGEMPPFLLDMASSIGAANKLFVFMKEGVDAPAGWGIDRNGNPTTDPEEIIMHGSLCPFGGIKGSGLAGWAGLVSAVPCGAEFMPGKVKVAKQPGDQANFGVFMQVTDVSKFMPLDEFCARSDAYLRQWRSLPAAKEGGEVYYPGYLEVQRQTAARENGINLLESTAEDLRAACAAVGLRLEDYL